MALEEPRSLSAGSVKAGEAVDRTAAGLSFQKYQMGLTATGAALGLGRRVAPDPSAQFSHPPVSNAQFGSGSNARATMGEEEGEF
jgi:hypothetical protein